MKSVLLHVERVFIRLDNRLFSWRTYCLSPFHAFSFSFVTPTIIANGAFIMNIHSISNLFLLNHLRHSEIDRSPLVSEYICRSITHKYIESFLLSSSQLSQCPLPHHCYPHRHCGSSWIRAFAALISCHHLKPQARTSCTCVIDRTS